MLKDGFSTSDELIKRLKALDDDVAHQAPSVTKARITIVGGGALVMLNSFSRITFDIDVMDIFSPELLPIMEKYDINARSNAFCDCVAYNYEDRLVKLDIDTKIIDFYLMSLEDIVIMKLFSDRGKDLQDIRDSKIVNNLDWDLLEQIISSGEANVYFNELRYKHFLEHYEEYKKECHK